MLVQIFVQVIVLEDAQEAVKDVTTYVEDVQEVAMELVEGLVQLVILVVKVVVLRDVHEPVILVQKDALLDVKPPVRVEYCPIVNMELFNRIFINA